MEIESLWQEAEEMESEVNATEEAGSKATALCSVFEDQERTLMFLEREKKTLKQLNAECEMKMHDLERRIGILEVRKNEEQSKRVREEEEMREKFGEKKKQIETLKQRKGLKQEGE
ncbi:peroxisomal and mitochondrial division factor 1-like [Phaseolus vulgaris]|uniref:peroxisomal and mitochondrial division factor 1-like n=1 Tax=Phaseolus vulgaris TaxID=3885 RepID=UPI0035C9A578